MTSRAKRNWLKVGILVLVLLGAIQLVPSGRSNPSVVSSPKWDSSETLALARRACFDCHSNETTWPAYARIAPVSWFIEHHVTEGRAELNFSEWQRPQKEAPKSAREVRKGDMPPSSYVWMHPEARLTDAEREALATGLANTFGTAPEKPRKP